MMAQQTNLDTVANNLANVNTPGFKRSRTGFQDLLYDSISAPAATPSSASPGSYWPAPPTGSPVPPAPQQVGHGVRVAGTSRSFRPGTYESTANPLDLAIDGEGFFCVIMPDGKLAYTRDGSFRLSGNRKIVTADGHLVSSQGGQSGSQAGISVPEGATQISITSGGEVRATASTGETTCGAIGVSIFANPSGLEALGHNLFRETPASGAPKHSAPAKEGAGSLLTGYLETSNVQVVEEMVNLIVIQRAYEMNAKSVQSSDEVLGITNGLVRR
jgi:flagellar basal-body rod protein FlgG